MGCVRSNALRVVGVDNNSSDSSFGHPHLRICGRPELPSFASRRYSMDILRVLVCLDEPSDAQPRRG